MDVVFTVCDSAAAETCPILPGHPVSAHLGLPDPAAAEAGGAQQRAFEETYLALEDRIGRLLVLPLETLEPTKLRQRLLEIGAAAGRGARA